ncbi:DUF1905 domain-containing protein [Pseudarthrobacter sp. MDT3-26]|uniref:DUF1905 domain-containing protein n=1 Tax=Pseudarthrobacter raffinosi TaxID=2953651 RepID=UPI00208ED865|nr:DUF1905 domain-containing protein [Pseudarthrobacter sp. MDT3-26]MCO4263603.1 DUF1905 domain-containing protein [Pseudarthrobacter sp. MDT3-26]
MTSLYSFRAELWRYPDESGWHFLTLPVEVADDLREEAAVFRRGFGSVKVTAEISGYSWQTSVFPDSKSSSYLLPVKKAARDAAGISDGDDVAVRLAMHGEGEAHTGEQTSGTG